MVSEIFRTEDNDALRNLRADEHALQTLGGERLVRIHIEHFGLAEGRVNSTLHAENSLSRGGFAVHEADLTQGKPALQEPVEVAAARAESFHQSNPRRYERESTGSVISLARQDKELPSYTLQRDRSLLIDGPASVDLVSGEAACLGAPLEPGGDMTVREEKRMPIETQTRALLDVRLGRGGSSREVQGSIIPAGWGEASQILRQTRGTIAILGDVDSGKSTLSTFLANECFKDGLSVGVLDADIGQADVGPPTTVSFSRLSSHIFSLQDLGPEAAFFVGDTSPSEVSGKLFTCLARLKEGELAKTDVLLVNTDGWVVGDEAVRYKLELLNTIRPGLIVGISSKDELDPIFGLLRNTTLKLERSVYARIRSKEERKRAREYGYQRFLRDAKRLEVRLGEVKLRRYDSYKQLKIREEENLRGVLAGLLDQDERLMSIGRVESLRNGIVAVRSSLQATPRIIELGAIVLSPKYEEIGFEA